MSVLTDDSEDSSKIVPHVSRGSVVDVSPSTAQEELPSVQDTFSQMRSKLRQYRDHATKKEKDELDAMWGLNLEETSPVQNPNKIVTFASAMWEGIWGEEVDVETTIMADIQQSREEYTNAQRYISKRRMSDAQIGMYLMRMFQKDMMPGINGKIVESSQKRESKETLHAAMPVKIVAWIFLLMANAFMLFYVFLFLMQQSESKQEAWLRSFYSMMGTEIFLSSTLNVAFTYVVMPQFIKDEVIRMKELLCTLLDDMTKPKHSNEIQNNQPMSTDNRNIVKFNSAEFLMGSYLLAKAYPTLSESKLILTFSTPFPNKAYNEAQVTAEEYSSKYDYIVSAATSVIVNVLSYVLNFDPHVQDMMFSALTHSMFGGVFIFLIKLWQIHPAIPFAILLGILLLVTVMLDLLTVPMAYLKKRLFPNSISDLSIVVVGDGNSVTTHYNNSASIITNQINHVCEIAPFTNNSLTLQSGVIEGPGINSVEVEKADDVSRSELVEERNRTCDVEVVRFDGSNDDSEDDSDDEKNIDEITTNWLRSSRIIKIN
jgi:hypothetical protein